MAKENQKANFALSLSKTARSDSIGQSRAPVYNRDGPEERDVSHMFRGDLQVCPLPFGLGEAHTHHLAKTVGGKRGKPHHCIISEKKDT